MNLVFNEYIKFLNDKGLKDQTGIELKEGYYWYDKSIIKAYDTNGNIHKVVRLKVNNDLSISFKRSFLIRIKSSFSFRESSLFSRYF